jgi:2-methylaconitate cis-trans-isomerase PrpF
LVETVAVDEQGFLLEQGDYQLAGVADPGVEIKVAFVDPAGSMTGTLLPTGNTQDEITIENPTALEEPFTVRATLIDAANPFVVVDAETMPSNFAQGSAEWLDTVEDIRRSGAVKMGLADNEDQAALTRGTPKIMMVSPPKRTSALDKLDPSADISVLAMSMGQIHPSVQLTGAVCLSAAACIPGTVAYRYCNSKRFLEEFGLESEAEELQGQHPRTVRIAHRSGQIPVEVHLRGEREIDRCVVSRSARKLFEGNVLFYE